MGLKNILFIAAAMILVQGCETDFDVTADWEDLTIVYGLLDQKESVQYIKINKAFLGEGNAMVMASNPDSSNYAIKLDVSIEEWNDDETSLIRTIEFDTITMNNKEDGVFPSPSHLLYKSLPYAFHNVTIQGDTFWLNQQSIYRLIISNPMTGKEVFAKTPLVHDFEIIRPGFETEMSFKFDLNNQDIKKDFKWDKPAKGVRNEFELIFRFREVDNTTFDTITRSITIVKTVITPSASQSEVLFKMRNQEFYEACLNKIPYADAAKEEQVKTRLHGYADVVISVAAEEFTNYINVYEPSTTIVQEKPVYTNVENGVGIFSSRYKKVKTKKVNAENQCYLNTYSLDVYNVNKDLKFFCDQ